MQDLGHGVQVLSRTRPLSDGVNPSGSCITNQTESSIQIINPRNAQELLNYNFSKCFSSTESNMDVFNYLKDSNCFGAVLEGTNSTCFAYGQTGSGKTHTMNGSPTETGIIPLAIQYLFDKISDSGLSSVLSVSYLEIYNEKIIDLMTSERRQVDLREIEKGQIALSNAECRKISNMQEFKACHEKCTQKRKTASTNLNEASSRSHFILRVNIVTRISEGNTITVRTSKLHLIDLAGSEDNKRTGNLGARMVESASINSSLFVLGKVIEALNANQARIPYRDSKLTRMLQDSLGGSAKCTLIVTLSPKIEDCAETCSTLNFANKATLVKNKVQVNEVRVEKPMVDRRLALLDWKKQNQKETSSMMKTPIMNILNSSKTVSPSISIVPDENSPCAVNQLSKNLSSNLKLASAKVKNETEELKKQIAFLEAKLKTQDKARNLPVSNGRVDIREETANMILDILNSGDEQRIRTLKQIGKKRATDLLEYFQLHGAFEKIEDLEKAGISSTVIESVIRANAPI